MPLFTWGDTVRVHGDAPTEFRPRELASVCALTEVDGTPSTSAYPAELVGTLVCLIEFGDGSSVEVAEHWLGAVDS